MPFLSEIYRDLQSNPSYSLYYQDISLLNSITPWESTEDAETFITNYLEFGGKGQLLNNFPDKYGLPYIGSRNQHIVSAYLLGIHLHVNLTKSKNPLCPDSEYRTFLYLWFLTCISHDMGYAFENEKENNEIIRIVEKGGIIAFCDEFNITYPSNVVCRTYGYAYVDFYFRNRANNYHQIDHGIAGGLYLYDGLLKALEEWRHLPIRTDADKYERDFNGRIFRIPHNPKRLFGTLANAVISHNIFVDTLNEWLIAKGKAVSSRRRFSIRNEPLIFILALADTLEPLKRFGFDSGCLEYLSLEFERSNTLVVSCNGFHDCSVYYRGLKSMEDWLYVTVRIDGNSCRITIL